MNLNQAVHLTLTMEMENAKTVTVLLQEALSQFLF